MPLATRIAALHAALWSIDRGYRLGWYIWPGSIALLICGWICLGGLDKATSSTPWGEPVASARARPASESSDLDIWPAPLRNDVRSCTTGNENWSARVEACSRLIESGLLNDWQMVAIYNQRGIHFTPTQPQRALADYASALKIRPQTPEVLMNRVTIHVTRGQWDAAVADSSRAIELLTPELAARARVIRARAYYMLRDNEKAKADLDQAARFDADDGDSHLVRGNIAYDEKRYAAAARYFEQYCRRHPHDPAGFIGRGMALEADSRFEEALVAFERAVKLDPSDSRATSGRDRVKRGQPCDTSLCWNQPKKMPGWQDTVGPR